MKKLIILLIFIVIAFYIFFYINNTTDTTILNPTPTITGFFPTPQNAKNRIEINYNNETYNLFYSPIENGKINVIPNFAQKVSSEKLIEENKCLAAINGGFYTTDNTPLGLFIANGKKYSSEIVNDRNLLTGFFSIDENNKPVVTNIAPSYSTLVIQTGPLLTKGIPFNASIDEYARRSLIAQDINNNYYLLMITLKDDIYSGPLLSDIPDIIFSVNSPFSLVKALNMDGGSASAYFDSGFHIKELSSIGSLVCITK